MNFFDLNSKTDFCDNISVRGYSHIKIDKECQDNSISWKEGKYCAIIVCDGHGGDKYIRSVVGSQLACEVGKDCISAFMDKFVPSTGKKIDNMLEQLERAIVSAWISAVESDYYASPVQEDPRFTDLGDSDKATLIKSPLKAYGSTFIAAVKTNEYSFILKLGDGNAVYFYTDGSCEIPEELNDENCQFNITTSLCNFDAALSFKHCFKTNVSEKTVSGITLTSDGIINCFRTEESFMSFMQNVYFGFGEDGCEKAKEELIPTLNHFSELGSGDDLSVAIIRIPFSSDEKALIEHKKEQEEYNRLKREAEQAKIAEEQARIAAEKIEREKMQTEKENEELREKLKRIEEENTLLQKQNTNFQSQHNLDMKNVDEKQKPTPFTCTMPNIFAHNDHDVVLTIEKEKTVIPVKDTDHLSQGRKLENQPKDSIKTIFDEFIGPLFKG